MKNYRITVAGTGYVGLSIAVLLSQHHKVTAVDVVPEKVEIRSWEALAPTVGESCRIWAGCFPV